MAELTVRAQEALLEQLQEEGSRGEISRERLGEIARLHRAAPAIVQSLYTFYFPSAVETTACVCNGLPCALRGAGQARKELEASGRDYETVSCLGYCAQAPVFRKDGRHYTLTPEGPREIGESLPSFVKANAQRLAGYRSEGGYASLLRFLREEDRGFLLDMLADASLRGMGGAGFSVCQKWKTVLASQDAERTVLVNGHEGEPGTFKDRLILEREPHRLLEGALVAALTVRAQTVIVALRKEYGNARWVLEESLAELEAFEEETGTKADLPRITLKSVGGFYVTGEETALLEALEGKRSEPRLRPPFPAEVGLYGKPTLVQNVETLALIPSLLAARYGTAAARGVRKYYCLTGDVAHPGAYRENLGIRIDSLLRDAGGSSVAELKAFLPGGLSGGLLPASKEGLSLDFDSVKREGCGLGTGAVISIGTDRCIAQVLQNIGGFFETESCGKCVPCRLGTAKLARLMDSLGEGKASEPDLEEGVALARLMQETSLCALGQVAGKSFLDAMTHFREELVAHTRGECPAHTCFGGGA